MQITLYYLTASVMNTNDIKYNMLFMFPLLLGITVYLSKKQENLDFEFSLTLPADL